MDDDALRRLVNSTPVPDRLLRNLRRAQHVDEWELGRVTHRLGAGTELNRREVDVLRALGDGGLTIGEVAVVLGCTAESVKSVLKTAKPKLGAKTTTQAVARAIRADLI